MMRNAFSRLPAKLWWAVAAIVALVGAGVLGGGVVTLASHDFSDVPNGAFYHSNVTWLKDREITLGCGGGKYCPNDFVTRGEMAAFLNRTGDALTPTFVDALNLLATGPLDLDASPVVCQTSSVTPTYEQQAVIMGRGSIEAAAAAPTVSFFMYGVYSTNNGATWSSFAPGWSAEAQATAAGQEVALPFTGHANLTPGTTYKFGLQFVGADNTTGGATADAATHWCAVTVELLNRNP